MFVRDRSLIMGQGGAGGKLGGNLGKKSQQGRGGGLPKLFCLMREGLERNQLVSSVTTRSGRVAGSASTVALHKVDYFFLLVEVVGEVKVEEGGL